MQEEALTGGIRGGLTRHVSKRRRVRLMMEGGYDAAAWIGGLLVGARAAGVMTGVYPTRFALWYGPPAVCVMVAGCGLIAGLYRRRHLRGSRDEVAAVILACFLTTCCLVVAVFVLATERRAALETIVCGAAFAVVAMLGARYVTFTARLRPRPAAPTAVKIIVFGAGDAGTELINRLATQSGAGYRPVAILDDDTTKRRLRIHGVPVLGGRAQLAEVAASTGAGVLVIAIAGGRGRVIQDLTKAAESCGLVPKVIPSVRELLTGRAQIEGVRDPRISDLLGRRAVTTDVASIREHITGRRVLVTGAGGSIGAELCRQLDLLGPAELIMLDRDESALHAIQLALRGRALLDSDETVLADIRDQHRVREVFGRFQPEIVFHAAALKHLPLLESYPAEALKSNVWGTLNVLEAAMEHGVQAFVNISTDKAADPVSVLGYSKRITERLTAHMAIRTGGAYLSVRFGNVLGSRGSVLTALSAQVADGGPVTVTDPQVTRYFMLADEAVHLVLQAAVIGRGGEVLVLDMGDPVGIADIARRLVASTGRELDIVFTGLRPGEKLTEDRLGHGETDNRPCHPLISQVPVPALEPSEVTGLDPDADPVSLRLALARQAHGPVYVGTTTVPPQERAAPATQPSQAKVASGHGPSVLEGLAMRFSMGPAQVRQPGHEPNQDSGGVRVCRQRPARGIGYVVGGGITQQRRALASRVDARQPAGKRLARRSWSRLLTPPDQFLQGERTGPYRRLGDHGVPEMVPGHGQHQVSGAKVGGADDAAAMRAELDPVRGHDRDDFRVRRISAAIHTSRAHRHRDTPRDQLPGQQRGRHRRPAYVRRTENDNTVYAIHRLMTGNSSPPAPNKYVSLSTPRRAHELVAVVLVVHSLYAASCGPRRMSDDFPATGMPAAVTCRSEGKS